MRQRVDRRVLVLALGAFVGALVGLLAAAIMPDRYEASSLLTVLATKDTAEASVVGYAQTYARLAARPSVSSPALREAGFLEAARDPQREIAAESSPDAPLIEVTATAGAAEDAARKANVVAEAMTEFVNRRESTTGLKLEVLAPATEPREPTGIGLLVAILAGALVGLLAAFLATLALPGAGAQPDSRRQ